MRASVLTPISRLTRFTIVFEKKAFSLLVMVVDYSLTILGVESRAWNNFTRQNINHYLYSVYCIEHSKYYTVVEKLQEIFFWMGYEFKKEHRNKKKSEWIWKWYHKTCANWTIKIQISWGLWKVIVFKCSTNLFQKAPIYRSFLQ